MSEWVDTKLGAFVESVSDTYKFAPDEKVIFLNTSDIYLGRVLNHTLENSSKLPGQAKKRISKGDFLFSEIRPANGRYALVDFDAEKYVVSTKLMVLRCNENIDVNYFRLFLTAKDTLDYLQMIAEDRSGTFPQITFDHISTLDITLPTLRSEQKAIASVLSSLDNKIDLLHRQNLTLEAMAETLFRQWFVEEAQEDWKEGNLGYFAVNPKDGVKPNEIDSETKYIGLEHIDRRNIALIQSGNACDVTSNKFLFAENDILFGKLRPYFHKVCFAPYSGVCSTDILVIRPKKPDYFAYCLFAFYQSAVVEYANLGSGGTRMPRTNWETLSQYPVVVPDDMRLCDFNNLIAPSTNKIKENISQIRTIEKLRDTLLPKLMSGEVRVAI